MVRKQTGLTPIAPADQIDAADIDYINAYLTGVDQSATDPVDIATTTRYRTEKLRIWNLARTADYVFVPSAITANRNITLPVLTGNDTFVFEAHSQTLTNKSISGLSNSISNIPKSGIPSSTVFNDQNNAFGAFYQDLSQIAAPSNPAAGTRRIFVDSATGELSVRTSAGTTISLESGGGGGGSWSPSATETLTNKTIAFADNTLTDVVSTNTAQNITGAKTFDSSTAKFKNAAGTFAYTFVGGTITADKTLTLPTFTVSNDIIISQTASADFNGGTKTFRNTVLRTRNPANTFSYIFNGAAITANRNVTIPLLEADDTFVMEAMTQTLTNKTISGANNTITNIAKSSIPSSVIHNDQNNAFGAFYQDITEISVPANPAAGTRRLYVDSVTGKLSVRTSAGTTISLEETGGGGSGSWDANAAETLTNKTIAFANNTLTDVVSTNTAQSITAVKTFNNSTIVVKDTDGSHGMTFVMPAFSSDKTLTFPLFSSADTLVARATSDVLTNKTIAYGSNTLTDVVSTNTAQTITGAKTFDSSAFKINNLAGDFAYTFVASAIAAARSIVIPLLTGNDTLVLENHAQTLTNKTIAFANNTLTNVASTNTAQSISANKTFGSGNLLINNPAGTAAYTFVASAIAAAKNITIPLLTTDDTLVTAAFAQTLTNKTLTSPIISTISNTGTLTLPTSTDTLVGRATTDTLTNKTLTTPVIATIKPDASNSLNLPVVTDTLVALTATQTLTGKTISGANNTISNIAKGSIPAETVYNDQNNAFGAFYQDLSQIAAPANPASGTRRVFVDSATGKLSVRTSAGTTVSLEEQGSAFDPNSTQTFTNKTIAYGSNTLTDVVSTNTAQTISAVKTFSSAPVIGTITNTGTLTLPTSTDTLVGRATTDTLTNKTINAANNTVVGIAFNPVTKIDGGWIGGTATAWNGFLQGATGTTVGTIAVTSDQLGKLWRGTTGAVSGNGAGVHFRDTHVSIRPSLNPKLFVRFRSTNMATSTRIFLGFITSNTAFPTGNTPLNTANGWGLHLRDTDTNFQIVRNNGGATATYVDTGVAKANATYFSVEIEVDSAASVLRWGMNGGALTATTTTAFPTTTTALYPVFHVETATAAARDLSMEYFWIEYPTV